MQHLVMTDFLVLAVVVLTGVCAYAGLMNSLGRDTWVSRQLTDRIYQSFKKWRMRRRFPQNFHSRPGKLFQGRGKLER